jgi:hypothetical protein
MAFLVPGLIEEIGKAAGFTTSKRNSYTPPLPKPYAGEFERFAPR